eukprot:Selendium_serpulae@DN2330_c0_g1_i1.p1
MQHESIRLEPVRPLVLEPDCLRPAEHLSGTDSQLDGALVGGEAHSRDGVAGLDEEDGGAVAVALTVVEHRLLERRVVFDNRRGVEPITRKERGLSVLPNDAPMGTEDCVQCVVACDDGAVVGETDWEETVEWRCGCQRDNASGVVRSGDELHLARLPQREGCVPPLEVDSRGGEEEETGVVDGQRAVLVESQDQVGPEKLDARAGRGPAHRGQWPTAVERRARPLRVGVAESSQFESVRGPLMHRERDT